MGFKDDHIFNQLRHNPKYYTNKIIPVDTLVTFLWYFVSKQSYSQRTDFFDGFLNQPWLESTFLLWIYNVLELDSMYINKSSLDSVDNKVDSLSHADLNKNMLFLFPGKNETVFMGFFEKLRNSIAHGTFNVSNRFFMLGQAKSKQISKVNFYYQTSTKNADRINYVLDRLEDVENLEELFKESIIRHPLVTENEDGLYYGDMQIIALFDFEFKLKDKYGKQIDQLKKVIEEYSIKNALLIIFCNTKANLDDDIELKNRNIKVVAGKQIYKFFDYNIKVISKPENKDK